MWRTLAAIFSALALAACSRSTTSSSSGASSGSSGASSTGSTTGSTGAGANGTVGPWSELVPLPSPRANHCSIAAQGFLVIAGGNQAGDGGFVTLDDVQVAPLLADGGLGAWMQAGTLPNPVSECTLAANGATLYLVDGIFDDSSLQGSLWTATLSGDGGLTPFTMAGSLPPGHDVIAGGAWIDGPTLVTEESQVFTDGGGALALLTAPAANLQPAGWSISSFWPDFVGRSAWAFDGSHLFSVGGYDDNLNPGTQVLVEAVPSSGAATVTTSLPAPTSFGCAVAVDGYLYSVGGKAQVYTGAGSTAVYASAIGDGGSLGAWSSTAAMPVGRTDMAMAVGGDFLYVTGGATDGPGDSTVLAARIRF